MEQTIADPMMTRSQRKSQGSRETVGVSVGVAVSKKEKGNTKMTRAKRKSERSVKTVGGEVASKKKKRNEPGQAKSGAPVEVFDFIPSLEVPEEVDWDWELDKLGEEDNDYTEPLDELSKNSEDQELGQGQVSYSLEDIGMDPADGKYCVNEDTITKLLVDAINNGTRWLSRRVIKERKREPEKLPDTKTECSEIVKALSRYVSRVPFPESVHLYSVSSSKAVTSKDGDEDWEPSHTKLRKTKGEPKSWTFVAGLAKSKEFTKMVEFPEEKKAFEKKMLDIMDASLGVDPRNWAVCEVGHILAFWIVKLYKDRGVTEDQLPRQLVTGKTHFLELHDEFDFE